MNYFAVEEYACGCGCGVADLKPSLLSRLNDIRAVYGRPMVLTSGYRCEQHNRDVGGATDSEHLYGEAVDVSIVHSHDRFKLLRIALVFGITRIGIGRDFIHLGMSFQKPSEVVWLY